MEHIFVSLTQYGVNMAGKNLIVVESPAKAKTINKFVGNDFKVVASVGHIKDLPKSKFGVDIDNGFKPQYILIKNKSKIVKELKEEAKKSNKIFVASDPDREGEAIAYHIAQTLEKINPNIQRIEFNEITKNAVKSALEQPRDIDMQRVYSQQARRVLDRIVGYKISPLLWKVLARGLSAGRVQSVALRLICEREEEIEKFVPQEYWNIFAHFKTIDNEIYKGKLIKIDGKKIEIDHHYIKNEEEAKSIVDDIQSRSHSILEIKQKTVTRKPPAPYITSTLQQDAIRRLNMSAARVMRIAQQLYEGIEIGPRGNFGLITYMRTDSTRISNEAIQAARDYIEIKYGSEYVPNKPNIFSKKQSAQDAHEAIRPTYLNEEFSPEKIKKYLTSEQYRLYDLIWKRFIACQMKPAKIDRVTVWTGDNKYIFETSGETVKFKGYLIVYKEVEEEEEKVQNADMPSNIPLKIQEKDPVKIEKIESQQEFTKPPARYTESALVRKLDQLGIGRPSTYAQIISTLFDRNYIVKEDKKLIPTELGRTVNKILVKEFPRLFNVKFTAEMENELDLIEKAQEDYLSVMKKFYEPFAKQLEKVENNLNEIKKLLQEDTDETCELCGAPMVIKWGRHGRFKACSNYPTCKNTKPLEENEPEKIGEKCPECGGDLVKKKGRFGEFIACSNYPTCKYSRQITLGIPCPKEGCDGEIVQKRSRRGKIFYGCSNYPECDFVSWYKPVIKQCPHCGNNYVVERVTKTKGTYLVCPVCKNKIEE